MIEVPERFLKGAGGVYYVYTFDQWSDGSTVNPRPVYLTLDKTFTACYVKSKYGIKGRGLL